MTQNTSSAVMQKRTEAHDSLDDFPTPCWSTRAVMEYVVLRYGRFGLTKLQTVREPCANRGYMVRPLQEYFKHIVASDIFAYDCGDDFEFEIEDYLFPGKMKHAEWTFMNPPFVLAEQFIMRSFETPGWVGTAAIVRTSFLEGSSRYNKLFSVRPPSIVAQHVERVIMTKGIVRDPSKQYWDEVAQKMRRPSTATSYCWLVWLDNASWNGTKMIWIPPCRRQLERPGDYPNG